MASATTLTNQQLSDLRLAFDYIDTDKSGTIEWGELYDVVKVKFLKISLTFSTVIHYFLYEKTKQEISLPR